MNDDATLLDDVLPSDDETRAQRAKRGAPLSFAESRKRARKRCRAVLGGTYFAVSVVLVAVGASVLNAVEHARSDGYHLGQCMPRRVVSDGSCVYLIVTYGDDAVEACAVPAAVAMRSSFGAAPGCFAVDANVNELTQRERADNAAAAKRWRAAINSSEIECAIPTDPLSVASARDCAALTTDDGYVAAAARVWNEHLVYVDDTAHTLRSAIDAATSTPQTSGVLSLTFGLLLALGAFVWLTGNRIDQCCSAFIVASRSPSPVTVLESAKRATRARTHRQD